MALGCCAEVWHVGSFPAQRVALSQATDWNEGLSDPYQALVSRQRSSGCCRRLQSARQSPGRIRGNGDVAYRDGCATGRPIATPQTCRTKNRTPRPSSPPDQQIAAVPPSMSAPPPPFNLLMCARVLSRDEWRGLHGPHGRCRGGRSHRGGSWVAGRLEPIIDAILDPSRTRWRQEAAKGARSVRACDTRGVEQGLRWTERLGCGLVAASVLVSIGYRLFFTDWIGIGNDAMESFLVVLMVNGLLGAIGGIALLFFGMLSVDWFRQPRSRREWTYLAVLAVISGSLVTWVVTMAINDHADRAQRRDREEAAQNLLMKGIVDGMATCLDRGAEDDGAVTYSWGDLIHSTDFDFIACANAEMPPGATCDATGCAPDGYMPVEWARVAESHDYPNDGR